MVLNTDNTSDTERFLLLVEAAPDSRMITVLIFAAVALASQATPVIVRQPAPVYVRPAPIAYTTPVLLKEETPKPYSFGYEAPAIGGGSSRHETSDGAGRVTGSYTVSDADGRLRVVDYYADETGFHANVRTNEPGTANQDPADVSVQSYAAPAVAPVVAPKVVAAPAPVYTVAAPVRPVARRFVAPVSYGVVPAYNTYAAPITYASHLAPPVYRSYAPTYIYK